MRAPLAPMGWPRATAPPFTLTFSGLSLSWRVTAIAATEKASLSSTRSTSMSRSQPVFVRSFSTASTGAIITHLGSTPLTACATIRAIGCLPSRDAFRSLVTINAAAPSFVPGALPAVTVPSFLKAGLSFASASMEVSSRGDSSYLMKTGSPFFCGTSMGRIWASKKHELRARRVLVAFDGELVLLFASDAVFFRNQFAGHAHMKIFVSVPEAVVDHRVDELSIADAVAGAGLRQKIGTVGHGLHPARHYNFRFTKLHGLRGQRDSFEAGTANFIDGHGGNAGMAAAFERCLPRGILAEPRLYNVAENSFVNLLCLEARAADGFRDDLAAEFGSGESGETALELADRRSNGGEDDGSFRGHDEPPDESRALL